MNTVTYCLQKPVTKFHSSLLIFFFTCLNLSDFIMAVVTTVQLFSTLLLSKPMRVHLIMSGIAKPSFVQFIRFIFHISIIKKNPLFKCALTISVKYCKWEHEKWTYAFLTRIEHKENWYVLQWIICSCNQCNTRQTGTETLCSNDNW